MKKSSIFIMILLFLDIVLTYVFSCFINCPNLIGNEILIIQLSIINLFLITFCILVVIKNNKNKISITGFVFSILAIAIDLFFGLGNDQHWTKGGTNPRVETFLVTAHLEEMKFVFLTPIIFVLMTQIIAINNFKRNLKK